MVDKDKLIQLARTLAYDMEADKIGPTLAAAVSECLNDCAAALEASKQEAQPDCAGGSPCTNCPDKKKCQRGCIRQMDGEGWKAECDDVDSLLRGLGLNPDECRTEGGSLNVQRTLSRLRDCMQEAQGGVMLPAEPPYEVLVMLSGEWHSSRHAKAKDDYKTLRHFLASITPATPAQAERCTYCDGTGDVHGLDGEWRGRCTCPAGQAQPERVALTKTDAARLHREIMGSTQFSSGEWDMYQAIERKVLELNGIGTSATKEG